MRTRRIRNHRPIMRWFLVLGWITVAMILVAFALSIWWRFAWTAASRKWVVFIAGGAATIEWVPSHATNLYVALERTDSVVKMEHAYVEACPALHTSRANPCEMTFPLWSPASLMIIANVVGSLRFRHVTDPTRCRTCQYDLTGNISGRCPECGISVYGAGS